jgi:hypothetical protein
MYLTKKEKCSPTALFDVPHKSKPMTAASIAKRFPEFAKEMDGVGEERCLLYFWKRNKETKVYEFIDEEAEEEIAEILGVEVYDEEKEKERYLNRSRPLTDEEIKDFKEELAFASQQMKEFLKKSSRKEDSEGSEN